MEEFVIEDGVLLKYILKETIVHIPKDVNVIGKGAFKGCEFIEKVIFEGNVTKIMENAFKGCKRLAEIKLPKSLIYIGEYAFYHCHSLKYITIPESVKCLEKCTFLGCDGLLYVDMTGVELLKNQVFLNAINIEKIRVSSKLNAESVCDIFTGCSKIKKIILCNNNVNKVYDIDNIVNIISKDSKLPKIISSIVKDIYRIYSIDGTVLVKFLVNVKEVEIPNGITSVAKSCFFDKKGMISIKFPKTLKEINSCAFKNCINLEYMEFENDDIIICDDTFKGCTTLRYITLANKKTYELKGLLNENDINIPDLIKSIHKQVIGNFVIHEKTIISYIGQEERVVIPDGIEIIGEKAFYKNEAVKKVIFPNTITKIKKQAFYNCICLQTVELNKYLVEIEEEAFRNCESLIRIDIPHKINIIHKAVFKRCKKLLEVKHGTNIKRIEEYAFYGCSHLQNIKFTENMISIGEMAFFKCLSLEKIVLPESIQVLDKEAFAESGVLYVEVLCNLDKCGKEIFAKCNNLKKLIFSNNVKKIGEKFAFRCQNLEDVKLSNELVEIGKDAFYGTLYSKTNNENHNKSVHLYSEKNNNYVMKYRKLGDTGLMVSEIAFGTIPILKGGAFVLPKYFNLDDDDAIDVMKYAFELGCNLYDTAIVPEYGDAEIKLGKFAKCVERENIIISDKARFFDYESMYDAVLRSCNNLKTYSDIYFVHQVDLKNVDMVFEKNGAIDALVKSKEEGRIRFVGVATHYYDILLRAVKDDRVDVVQGSGNVLERGMIDRIEKEKLFAKKGFILNKVYAAGILPTFFRIDELISNVLSYPISTALIGMGTKEQVEQAIVRANIDYKRSDFEEIIEVLQRDFDVIECDRCQRCECIYGTEIHIIFRMYNYYFMGKQRWALKKLGLNIKECADMCSNCIEKTCVKQCPKSINIPNIVQIVNKLVCIHEEDYL